MTPVPLRVAVLHDDVDARPHASADERGVLPAVDAVLDSLRALGHAAIAVPVGRDVAAFLRELRDHGTERVFNLCEGVAGASAGESAVAAIVELLGLPLTGSGSATLALSRRKDRVNAVLRARGLPVPPWTTWSRGEDTPAWSAYPAIVKPAAEDGSVGIHRSSVVRTELALSAALEHAAGLSPLLVQRFVGERELMVGFLGDQALPVSEIDFGALPADRDRVVTYDAKWSGGSVDDRGTRSVCPAPLDRARTAAATDVARRAWDAVDGRGYGRVDLRMDANGGLHVIEVNPNPDLDPGAGLARMARAAGLDFTDLVERILAEAGSAAASEASDALAEVGP